MLAACEGSKAGLISLYDTQETPPATSMLRTPSRKNSFLTYVQKPANHYHGGALAHHSETAPTKIVDAILATALYRCWHIILFFTAWATTVTILNEKVLELTFQPTLLSVIGTVLGFVISYRTTSSFERYNEGRRYWSQIILASRTLTRAVWFHVPELPPATPKDDQNGTSDNERRARNLIEKKTVINLIQAFSVAVKHYLRGEEGIPYEDLYHLVKFLPSYAFPTGVIPTESEVQANLARTQSYRDSAVAGPGAEPEEQDRTSAEIYPVVEGYGDDGMNPSIVVDPASPEAEAGNGYSPAAPADGARPQRHVSLDLGGRLLATASTTRRHRGLSHHSHSRKRPRSSSESSKPMLQPLRPTLTFVDASSSSTPASPQLLPASLPPKFALFDVFPFSLCIRWLEKKVRPVEGKTKTKVRTKMDVVTRNVPLEISMYLTSYVATLGARKAIDVPTNNLLIATVNQLTDALTGLERILTTPIPFSYTTHLWLVTIIYNLALPFQIYESLRWITIPASGVVSFIFFGFLVAGEEIENPFGYDKNDLNMDHFTSNIIRNELHALTAFPPPSSEDWIFSPHNDRVFALSDSVPFNTSAAAAAAAAPKGEKDEFDKSMVEVTDGTAEPIGIENRKKEGFADSEKKVGLTPEEWVQRGEKAMRNALARVL